MKNNFQNKLYRIVMAFFPVAKNRRGKCRNCGSCCQLPTNCVFLRFEQSGKSYCVIKRKLGFAFLNCQKYPRTEKEWITSEKCGYWFKK